jgi:hypothetical protein
MGNAEAAYWLRAWHDGVPLRGFSMSDDDTPRLANTPEGTTAPPAEDQPAHADRGFTVAELRRRWRIGVDKILGFIRRGELIAVNVRTSRCGRAQYRITPDAVRAFEESRSSKPPRKPQRRRPHQRPAVDYIG